MYFLCPRVWQSRSLCLSVRLLLWVWPTLFTFSLTSLLSQLTRYAILFSFVFSCLPYCFLWFLSAAVYAVVPLHKQWASPAFWDRKKFWSASRSRMSPVYSFPIAPFFNRRDAVGAGLILCGNWEQQRLRLHSPRLERSHGRLGTWTWICHQSNCLPSLWFRWLGVVNWVQTMSNPRTYLVHELV